MASKPQRFNFAAGPSALNSEVLERCSKAVLELTANGESILEISHRSKDFQKIIDHASLLIRELLKVPENYHILFMQGGGTGQFAASILNMMAHQNKERTVGDYLVTGSWSKAAMEEAKRLGIEVNVVCDGKETFGGAFRGIPSEDSWKFTEPSKAAYVYYCANETVNGVEFHGVPSVHPDVPLICDMSSNIMARPIDVSKFSIIFAGAQKNLGPAGVTVAIVKDTILERKSNIPIPTALDYAVMAKNGSLYNTPPTFSILALQYNLEWVASNGGNDAMYVRAQKNASKLYAAIDASNGFYSCPVLSNDGSLHRSLTNIVFNLKTLELEELFVSRAQTHGLFNLKGHRSVGGIRASLYNGVPDEATEALIKFMCEFQNAES